MIGKIGTIHESSVTLSVLAPTQCKQTTDKLLAFSGLLAWPGSIYTTAPVIDLHRPSCYRNSQTQQYNSMGCPVGGPAWVFRVQGFSWVVL